jgi:hypothetical protein
MKVSAEEHAQNPFCSDCYEQRLAASGAKPHASSGDEDWITLAPTDAFPI